MFIIGKLHPLLVHLPIGFMLASFLLEIYDRRSGKVELKPAIAFMLLFTALSAVASSISGWWIPKEGAYDESLVNTHFWWAISLTGGSIALWILNKLQTRSFPQKIYFPFFIVNIVALGITGHYGGSLTHGSNYLFEKETSKLVQVEDVDQLMVYEDIIQPIFKKKCFSCHNGNKQKGKLDMSYLDGLKKGGETGPLFLAGRTDESLILKRINLPKSDEEHMPPDGKSQLSFDEINLIHWWIKEGANFEAKAGNLNKDDLVINALDKYRLNEQGISWQKIKPKSESDLQGLRRNGILVQRLSEENPLLSISLTYDTLISKQKLKRLSRFKKHINQLNLSFSSVSNEMLETIKSFENLQKLDLQGTAISQAGIQEIRTLKNIEILNLYGTQVDDNCLDILTKMKTLKKVFLWGTKVSDAGVQKFIASRPEVEVNYKISEDLFEPITLKPPLITAAKDLFKDTLSVQFEYSFKNVNLYYTLDGSDPDTTSLIYDQSILLDTTVLIRVFAHKPGWYASEVAERLFIQTRFEVANVSLSKAPDDKYKSKGANSLKDHIRGTFLYSDGTWLGYQKSHLTVTMDLGSEEDISSLVVGALEDPNNFIFYPKSISVSTSLDGKDFQKAVSKKYQTNNEVSAPETNNFILLFEKTEARYVQVFIESQLVNPEWHPFPGRACWLFIDEVYVN